MASTFMTTMRPTPFGYSFIERKNKPGVYLIEFSNTKYYYIGSSGKCSNRITQHLSDLRLQKHRNKFLQHVYNKHKEEFKVSFEYTSTKTESLQLEQNYLDKCHQDNFCMNISKNATSPSHSVEGIKILSEKAKLQHKNNNFNSEKAYAYHKSVEGRKLHSQFAKKQREDPQYTINLTSVLREKLKKYYDIILINSNGDEIFIGWNLREFCRKNFLDRGNIDKLLKGKSKTCQGWRLKNG